MTLTDSPRAAVDANRPGCGWWDWHQAAEDLRVLDVLTARARGGSLPERPPSTNDDEPPF